MIQFVQKCKEKFFPLVRGGRGKRGLRRNMVDDLSRTWDATGQSNMRCRVCSRSSRQLAQRPLAPFSHPKAELASFMLVHKVRVRIWKEVHWMLGSRQVRQTVTKAWTKSSGEMLVNGQPISSVCHGWTGKHAPTGLRSNGGIFQ